MIYERSWWPLTGEAPVLRREEARAEGYTVLEYGKRLLPVLFPMTGKKIPAPLPDLWVGTAFVDLTAQRTTVSRDLTTARGRRHSVAAKRDKPGAPRIAALTPPGPGRACR